jgi:hypothetical protein
MFLSWNSDSFQKFSYCNLAIEQQFHTLRNRRNRGWINFLFFKQHFSESVPIIAIMEGTSPQTWKNEKNFPLVPPYVKKLFRSKTDQNWPFFNKNCEFLSIFSLKTSIFQSNFSPAELFLKKKSSKKIPPIWSKITTLGA